MKNPSQALIWSAFSQSWPALLTQIAGVVSAIFLLDLLIYPGVDSQIPIEVADSVLIMGFALLYFVELSRRQNPGGVGSPLGFPYRIEFSHPVATSTLTFVPLFFFCAHTQAALFIPIIIVNLLFLDVEISFLPLSFITFQITIFALMLAWWTQNGLAALLGLIITVVMYVYGFLMPEFTRLENTWVIETSSSSGYIVPLLCTVAMLVITYFGVRQQRSGETFLHFGQSKSAKDETGVLRDLIPLLNAQCPIESPIKAEIWKQRQLSGEYGAAFAGLFVGLFGAVYTLAILGLVSIDFLGFFVPSEDSVQFSFVKTQPLAMYFIMCVVLTSPMFGVSRKNGVVNVSVHTKTTPLSTAQLTLVRVSISLLSALIACLVMATVVWLLGSFLIEGFQELRAQFFEPFTFLAEMGFAGGSLRMVLALLAFLTALVLSAIFITWLMLHPVKVGIGTFLFCVYMFLVFGGLFFFFGQGEDFKLILATVGRGHSWILILSIPITTVIMLRRLLLDWVISKVQLIWILVIGCALQGINLLWLFGASNYDALNLDITITTLSFLMMLGFLPLLAAVFALWTTNRIRHG